MSTYTPIATQTLSSTSASVTFAGIPQNYTDLVLVITGQISVTDDAYGLRFNNDTGSNYSVTAVYGSGSSAISFRSSNDTKIDVGRSGNDESNSIIQIMNYSNTTTFKTIMGRGNNPGDIVITSANLWRSTSAINAIEISVFGAGGRTLSSGSTFSIYGIAAGSTKATGGIVTNDGTYYYHTFLQSGIFTPNEALSVDYLVVAGGGGTPLFSGGGGGGGYRTSIGGSQLSLLSQNYAVTIGAGGANTGTNGSDSIFSTITATGGGAGGGSNADGASGGSGGGGGMWNGVGTPALSGGSGNTPSTSPSQGKNGGAGSRSSNSPAGGGGGASADGNNGVPGAAGNGGAGTTNSITGLTYAGGGGASSNNSAFVTVGTGGAGGGGNGVSAAGTANGNNGTVNTGGGAGGGGNTTGGNGGSGIVIIRYAL